MTHPNVVKVQTMMEAWNRGDVEDFLSYFSPDASWHVGGNSRFAGAITPREFFVQMSELMDGRSTVTPLDILADDNHVVAFLRVQGEREGGLKLDQVHADAWIVNEEGLFSNCWWLPDDPAEMDRFMA